MYKDLRKSLPYYTKNESHEFVEGKGTSKIKQDHTSGHISGRYFRRVAGHQLEKLRLGSFQFWGQGY